MKPGTAVALACVMASVAPADAFAVPQDTIPATVLDPLVITIDRSGTPSPRLPYAHTVLDGPGIVRGRTTDGLDDVVLTVPGVLAANRYNYALDQRLAIRGFGARSAFGVRGIKVILDGIPQTTADGQAQLTNLEPGDLTRLEVWRGVASSLYGNASGGVVNLITSTGPMAPPTATLRVSGGAFGFRKGALTASLPAGRGVIGLTGSWSDVGGFRQHSAARFARSGLRYERSWGDGTDLTVSGWYAHMPEALSPGALTAEEMERDPTLAAPRNVEVGARKAVWQAQGGARFRHRFSPLLSGEVTAHGTRRGLDNTLTFAAIELGRWAGGLRAVAIGALPGARPAGKLTAGLDVDWQADDRINRSIATDGITLDQMERVAGLGPFVQAVVEPAARLSLRAGVRYDRVRFALDDRLLTDGDASGVRVLHAVTWSVGVLLQAHRALVPFANVGTAFETPTTTELVNQPDGSGGLNRDLDPQRSLQVEGGIRGRLRWLQYEAVVFRTEVRDAIVPFEDPAVPDRRFFRNAGRVRHQGIELTSALSPSTGVEVQASYGFGDYVFREFSTPDGDFAGNRLPGVARHQVAGVLALSRSGGTIGAEVQYLSGIPVDDANSAEAPGRVLTNLRVGWDGRLGGVRVSPGLTLLNVLDVRYAGSVVVNAQGGRFYEPAPGRNLFLVLSVGF